MAACEEIPEENDMDMSVSVAPEKRAAADEAKSDQIVRSPNASDLDEWLAKVDAMGELKRIKGHPGHRALYNMIGCNLSRFCLMIGEEPMDHPLKAVQALQKKMGRT